MELTHTDSDGKASMVDVGEKQPSEREATASALVKMQPETLALIAENKLKKGDVLCTARIAGIAAAKRTWELIPLCHRIPIDCVSVDFEFVGNDSLKVTAYAKCFWKTGIEMEALTAATVASLTVYDMCKSVDRSMTVESVMLLRKSGGRSGEYIRNE